MKLKTFLLLCILSATAQAGEVLRHAEAPEPKPEKPQKIEPAPQEDLDLEPQVTITKKATETVEEYRVGGKLYMIKITPKSGPPYYLIDDRGDGRFARQEGLDTGLRVPHWVIKKF